MFYSLLRVERNVAVRELNQRTSAVLAEVARGTAVTITSGGRPIARLVPIGVESPALDRLVQGGRATAPTTFGPIPLPPAAHDSARDVAALLAEDREAERW